MKILYDKIRLDFLLVTGLIFLSAQTKAQIQNFRPVNQSGLHIFEAPKDTTAFDGLVLKPGGAFALQFQALDHSNTNDSLRLIELGNNFNLPTANFDFDAQLADGVRMHLRTYLSSRHHSDAWVKGGYLQFDKLPFTSDRFNDNIMRFFRIKMGLMEVNYGDAHFRRTDNAMGLYNPFVGNLIMDGFNTEMAGEAYFMHQGFIGMLGLSNGKLNQGVGDPGEYQPVLIGKIGYDRIFENSLRTRLTGSVYYNSKSANNNLYSGDRAGSRYYRVMELESAGGDDFRSGRWNPQLSKQNTSMMLNALFYYEGLEFFGTYEYATGGAGELKDAQGKVTETDNRGWIQYAMELIYHFGKNEQFYFGGRFNAAYGEEKPFSDRTVTLVRVNGAAGWFITPNIKMKLEYIYQEYQDFDCNSKYRGGKFSGFMLEGVVAI